MKRQGNPQLSAAGELALTQYEQALREVAKLLDVSPRDLRVALTIAWPNRSCSMVGHDSLDTTNLYIQGMKQGLQEAAQTTAWT